NQAFSFTETLRRESNFNTSTLQHFNTLILLTLIREIPRLHIIHITRNSIIDNRAKVCIAAEEAGLKFFGDTQHVLHDEDLPIGIRSGADANSRDLKGLRNFLT